MAIESGFYLARWQLRDGIPINAKPEIFYDIRLSTLRGPSRTAWYPNHNVPAVVAAPSGKRLWLCKDLNYPSVGAEDGITIIGTTLAAINIESDTSRNEYDIPIVDQVGVAVSIGKDDIPVLIVERTKNVR